MLFHYPRGSLNFHYLRVQRKTTHQLGAFHAIFQAFQTCGSQPVQLHRFSWIFGSQSDDSDSMRKRMVYDGFIWFRLKGEVSGSDIWTHPISDNWLRVIADEWISGSQQILRRLLLQTNSIRLVLNLHLVGKCSFMAHECSSPSQPSYAYLG